jgi:cell wall-associated NlpC family hydrolase
MNVVSELGPAVQSLKDCRATAIDPITKPMGPRRFRRLTWRSAVVTALVLAGAACASSPATSVARPSPFPGAAPPPLARPPVGGTAPGGGAVVRTALDLLGVDYRFGGEHPSTGLDCSGLVRYVFDQHALDVPRTVDEQYQVGDRIGAADLQAGDLIFFSTIGPGATHVGIALGAASPGAFVHAPGTGSVVRVDRYDAPYWRQRIVGMRRVLPVSSPPGAIRPFAEE